MESTSEMSSHTSILNRTLFYSGLDLDLDEFEPYFFLGELPRDNSNYDSLLLLFSQENVQQIRSGKTEYREDELSDTVREDCLHCKINSALYEVDALSQIELVGEDSLRKVRLCGDCFETILSEITEHIQKESQIIQYEL